MEDGLLDELEEGTDASVARLSDWLWHPWYAKLWWALIPIYWLSMGEPTRPAFLNGFAESGYATITNIIFIPITALAVLGLGFLRNAAISGRLAGTGYQQNRLPLGDMDEFSGVSLRGVNHFQHILMRNQSKH